MFPLLSFSILNCGVFFYWLWDRPKKMLLTGREIKVRGTTKSWHLQHFLEYGYFTKFIYMCVCLCVSMLDPNNCKAHTFILAFYVIVSNWTAQGSFDLAYIALWRPECLRKFQFNNEVIRAMQQLLNVSRCTWLVSYTN